MTKAHVKPIQIFKPGTHAAMRGGVFEFGESHLRESAAAYDPALHEAPLVVGHPKHNAPAYGWVQALAFCEETGTLDAIPDQVDPAFGDLVAAGRFKKISASFYHPTAQNNPKPGVYYLRHVGFLGAQPPAVKGLKDAEFGEDEEGVVTVEFGDRERWGWRAMAALLRSLRERWIEKDGLEAADQALPNYLISDIERAGDEETPPAPAPAFSETAPQEAAMDPAEEARQAEFAEREAALARRAEELEARERAAADREAAARRTEIAEFAEQLVTQGRVLPRERDGLVEFMAALDDATLEFGEGEERRQVARGAWLREFLAGLPERVDFAERTAPGAEGDDATVEFAAPEGYAVDPAQMERHRKATAYMRAHNTDYDTALTAVS